mgnify:CR=1 FL=1
MNGGKHSFSYTADPTVNPHDHLSVQVETQAVTLENMVQAFEAYLLACGYVFPVGHHLDWVEDETERVLDDGDEHPASANFAMAAWDKGNLNPAE